jgi:hypothetical protein
MTTKTVIKGECYWLEVSRLLRRNRLTSSEVAKSTHEWTELSKLLRSKTDEHKKSLSS